MNQMPVIQEDWKMPVSFTRSVVIILVTGLTIFFTRLIPFLFFPPGKEIPPTVQYLGKVLPPAVIGMLVVYCLRGVSLTNFPFGAPEAISILTVSVLHVWKRSNLLSIGAGTVIYMLLVQTVFAGS